MPRPSSGRVRTETPFKSEIDYKKTHAKSLLEIPKVKPFKSNVFCGITSPALPKQRYLLLDVFDEDIRVESNSEGVFVNGLKFDDWAQSEIDKINLNKVKRYFKTIVIAAIEAESLYQPFREKSLKAVKASQAKARLKKKGK
jgi:hypothetical protein